MNAGENAQFSTASGHKYRLDPVHKSSYFLALTPYTLFAARFSGDYLSFTPGRKSAWGVPSLWRSDVG